MLIAGHTIRRTIGNGSEAFVMWREDCFTPELALVRGENASDAREWFICDRHMNVHYVLNDDDTYLGDYVNDWHGPVHATLEDVGDAMMDGASYVTMNDNGELMDTENVNGMTLDQFRATFGPRQ